MTEASPRELRVLLCLAAAHTYYEAEDDEQEAVKAGLKRAFERLEERFDVRVLGAIEDDLLAHGATHLPHYRAYILLAARDLDTAVELCKVVKETRVGPYRLWRYLGLDARLGRTLPFVEIDLVRDPS